MEILFGIVIIIWIIKAAFFGSEKSAPVKDRSTNEFLAKQGIGTRRQNQRYLEIEKPELEISEEIQAILNLLENTHTNIFLTGKAGTGKSTLLKYFRATTKKNVVVLAPTGVAALNVQGQTIHRFFKFGIDITLDRVRKLYGKNTEIYSKIDTLVIDEISMVRADLFDCIDKFLKVNRSNLETPFGGVQIVVIGDLYQLPPIVKENERNIFERYYKSPFFFNAKCFESSNFHKFELTHVYRQTDQRFIEVLNAIRLAEVTSQHIDIINERLVEIDNKDEDENFRISLVPTNALAEEINMKKLGNIDSKLKKYQGTIVGDFDSKSLPTEQELCLKEGAQIMLLNNDKNNKWVNGDIVKVLKFLDTSIRVLFQDGTFDEITVNTWDNVKFVYSEEEKKIKSEITGSFTQYPMKLAWAITIHKSQGKTYDKVSINFGSGTFASGHAYVALSRCRSLEGIYLKSPLELNHIFIDQRVSDFMKERS